jgi:hypothetical protein
MRFASERETGPYAKSRDAIAVGDGLRNDVADAEGDGLFLEMHFDGHCGDRIAYSGGEGKKWETEGEKVGSVLI